VHAGPFFLEGELQALCQLRAGCDDDGLMQALLSGQPGQAWPYSVESGSIRVVEVNPAALSAGRQLLLDEVVGALAAGSLDPGVDPQGP